MKLAIREMHEPLLTYDLYTEFVALSMCYTSYMSIRRCMSVGACNDVSANANANAYV
jgi:hypothetical protein